MISSDPAIELLFRMKRLRAVEETIAAKYSEQQMRCPVHLSTGQEAVSAAVGLALRKDDYATSGHRAHTHYLGKGGDLKAMLAEIYGRATGCSKGKGGSMHLIDQSVGFMGSTAIVGGTIPVGVGFGLAIALKKTDQISCIFLGDGAIEEGVFYESANFAALKKLPVLFVCENNLYSVYSHIRVRQPEARKISEMVRAMGIPSLSGDGNDAEEVFATTQKSIAAIRSGGGPQFLEFSTYRWREHCGPAFDNDIGYRTEEEYLSWKANEPIARLEKKMLSGGRTSAAAIFEFEKSIDREVQEAFAFAKASPFPEPHQAYTDLFLDAESR